MIFEMLSNKKLNRILTELFIRGRELNMSLSFFIESYFAVQKILDRAKVKKCHKKKTNLEN